MKGRLNFKAPYDVINDAKVGQAAWRDRSIKGDSPLMPVRSFQELDPAERDLLASVFYKVGVWIGQAEDADGDEDDRLEEQAIRRILESLAGVGAPSAFIQAAARAALESDEKWPQWADDSFDILPDVAKVRELLKRVLDKKGRDQVCAALCELAAGVAEAFGEFAANDDVPDSFLARILTRIRDRIEGVEAGAMNVSPAESAALDDLESTLRGAQTA